MVKKATGSKTWWLVALSAVTGELSTAAFRGLMTVTAVCLLTGLGHVREIWRVPEAQQKIIDEQKRVADELKGTIVENVKKLQDADELARASLVTKVQLMSQMADWQKQRDALNKMVESHDQRIAEQSGKLDALQHTVDKILDLLTGKKLEASTR